MGCVPNIEPRYLNTRLRLGVKRVVTGDVEGFKRYIVGFVVLSAITGAIGSVQQLCFRLAGFRMAIGARNKLFRGVISQVRRAVLLLLCILHTYNVWGEDGLATRVLYLYACACVCGCA